MIGNCCCFRNSNHGIIHTTTTTRFKRDARELDEDEEIWFDQDDDDVSGSPNQSEEKSIAINSKLKDIDSIDNFKKTVNNIGTLPSSQFTNQESQSSLKKKITDSQSIASLTSTAPAVNSRKVRCLLISNERNMYTTLYQSVGLPVTLLLFIYSHLKHQLLNFL